MHKRYWLTVLYICAPFILSSCDKVVTVPNLSSNSPVKAGSAGSEKKDISIAANAGTASKSKTTSADNVNPGVSINNDSSTLKDRIIYKKEVVKVIPPQS